MDLTTLLTISQYSNENFTSLKMKKNNQLGDQYLKNYEHILVKSLKSFKKLTKLCFY